MRWKWIVGIIAAVFVVLLVVVYIIAASYDYNKLKPLVTDAAREYTGRELTLGGDINLTIGFPPTLEVNDIAFQNAPWGSQPADGTAQEITGAGIDSTADQGQHQCQPTHLDRTQIFSGG